MKEAQLLPTHFLGHLLKLSSALSPVSPTHHQLEDPAQNRKDISKALPTAYFWLCRAKVKDRTTEQALFRMELLFHSLRRGKRQPVQEGSLHPACSGRWQSL